MDRKGFTLIELMVIIIIIGILATLGIPAYQGFVEDSKSQVCQNNLLTLKSAMDSYLLDRGVVPADLSQIPGDYIRKAFVQRMKEGGLGLRLAYIAVAWDERGYAYADIIDQLASGNLKLLHCPSAKAGDNSYGVCEQLLDISPKAYKQLSHPDDPSFGPDSTEVPFIADCGSKTFSSMGQIKCRHAKVKPLNKKEPYANVVFQDGMVCGLDENGDSVFVTSQGVTLGKSSAAGSNYATSTISPNEYGTYSSETIMKKMRKKLNRPTDRFFGNIGAIKEKYPSHPQ